MLEFENQDGLPEDAQADDSLSSTSPTSAFDVAKASQRMRDQALLKSAGNPRHPSGHVQMYDGSQWISDFKQKHFSPYGSDVPRSTIYRLGGVAR